MGEPEKKDGIWIQTNHNYQNIMINQPTVNNEENGVWTQVSTPPISTIYDAIVYNGEIHIFDYNNHYKWNGFTWSIASALPHTLYNSSEIAVYNNGIHVIGYSQNNTLYNDHWIWDGSIWTKINTFPNGINADGAASLIEYNGDLHIINGGIHYKWNNISNTYTTVSYNVSGTFRKAIAVFNGCIYGFKYNNTYDSAFIEMYIYNGTSWSNTIINMEFSCSCLTVLGEEMYLFGFKDQDMTENCYYKYNKSGSFIFGNMLPFYRPTAAVIYDNEIHIFPEWSTHYKYQLPSKIYNPNTIIIKKSNPYTGTYLTAIADTSIIQDDNSGNNRFVSGFDDVFFFADTAFENAPMYYGNGTQWVKFKN